MAAAATAVIAAFMSILHQCWNEAHAGKLQCSTLSLPLQSLPIYKFSAPDTSAQPARDPKLPGCIQSPAELMLVPLADI